MVAVVWWRTKQWWFAVVPLIAISLQALVFFFTTLLIDRERPDVEKLDDSPPTSSFPSGHTGAATGLYFTLALMALRIKHPVVRGVVVGVFVLIPLLVASARLYRGMHHVSDVLVAILNGVIAALLAWCWLRRGDAVGRSDPGVAGPRERVHAVGRQAERDPEQDDRAAGQVQQRVDRPVEPCAPCPRGAGSRR